MTVEGMIKIVYDLLKDKLNIVKFTFMGGVSGTTRSTNPIKISTAVRYVVLLLRKMVYVQNADIRNRHN